MGYHRDTIVSLAEWWAEPGIYKPDAEELVKFFSVLKKGQEPPTIADAQAALDAGGTGVKADGDRKQWCGIFACYVLRQAGLSDATWDLVWDAKEDSLTCSGVHKFRKGHDGMMPGDVALIRSHNHHFIVTEIDYSKETMRTVEGNKLGQYIQVCIRRPNEVYGYYRIKY